MRRRADKVFLGIILALVGFGTIVFLSASLGLLARDGDLFSSVAFNQFFFGLFLGTIALLITSNIPYRIWRPYAFYLFLAALATTLLVFVPGIGFSSGGASRWLDLGPLSFQPGEFLKIAFVLYFAALLSSFKARIKEFRYAPAAFLALAGLVAAILLSQPDIGTLLIISVAGFCMLFASGARIAHLLLIALGAVLAFLIVAYFKPYALERVLTFIDPSRDPYGAGYQIQQSLIAIGSGEISGRGFGQSVQKFNFLPEPIGDSIFAVASEEFGFIGAGGLILLFVFFVLRGLFIAARAPDQFSGLVVTGIVILISFQSFINIGSLLGVFPLTGEPLVFVSHGGTALFAALAEVGIILNISKYRSA